MMGVFDYKYLGMYKGLVFLGEKFLKNNFWDFGSRKKIDERHQAIALILHVGHGGRVVTTRRRQEGL
jgi:hypothetical protein